MLTWWTCLAASADARQTTDVVPGQARGAVSPLPLDAARDDPERVEGSQGGKAGIESDPITCWWRTDRSAVHVGEQFTLTLTCGVIETAGIRVVTDADRLDPAALDLTPFEIVGGTRHRDIQAPPRRYFQYSYTVRLLGDELFGRDVDIPSIPITYNIESSGATGARGRDQLYLLPPLPVRMLSLVPLTATDIQDASPDTFGDIDRRAFRATGELAAAGVLFTFAAVLAGLAVVRIARPRVARAAAGPGLLPPAQVLRGCIREAARLKSETGRAGWTADLIDGSLTVFRIAGAVALGRSVAQRVVDRRVAAQDGQLRIRKGALTATRVLMSGATTSAAVASRLANGNGGTLDPRLRTTLEELGESLGVFTASRYSRIGDLDAPALDAALDMGIRALRRLHAMKQWPARAADALSRAADRVKGAVWDR